MSKDQKQISPEKTKHIITSLVNYEAIASMDKDILGVAEHFLAEDAIKYFAASQLAAAEEAIIATDPDRFDNDQDFTNFARAQRLHVRFWRDFHDYVVELAVARAANNEGQ